MMTDTSNDIRVQSVGPQIHILDQGREVALAIQAQDGRRHRLVAATSTIGNLITYLTRARTKAVERLDETGTAHQVTTSIDPGTVIEPKSVNLGVARDGSKAVLQVADDKGVSFSIQLGPDLVAALAQQMARAAKDMAR